MGLQTESFEQVTLSGQMFEGATSQMDFGDFSVSSTPAAVKVADQAFFGYSGVAVTSFMIDSVDDSGFGLDDLGYACATTPALASVPLPAGLPFLLAGLGGFAVLRRTSRWLVRIYRRAPQLSEA